MNYQSNDAVWTHKRSRLGLASPIASLTLDIDTAPPEDGGRADLEADMTIIGFASAFRGDLAQSENDMSAFLALRAHAPDRATAHVESIAREMDRYLEKIGEVRR
jgi:hypothetical protein